MWIHLKEHDKMKEKKKLQNQINKQKYIQISNFFKKIIVCN